nr:MAG TPA: hypothetical protein [Caudoviricetes sp.]
MFSSRTQVTTLTANKLTARNGLPNLALCSTPSVL